MVMASLQAGLRGEEGQLWKYLVLYILSLRGGTEWGMVDIRDIRMNRVLCPNTKNSQSENI